MWGMRPRGRTWASLWGICSLALLAACASPEIKKIHLGLIVQEGIIDGVETIRAVELAVARFNEAGGLEIDGEPHLVELHYGDPLGKPEEAARTALQLINQAQVFALVGPSLSINAIPVAEVAQKAGIPMVSPASTNVATTAGKPYAFRVSYTDSVQGAGLARFAHERLGAAQAAVLFDRAEPYSRDLAEAFRKSFENDGGSITFLSYVEDGWDEALAEIARQAPDVLFLPDFEDAVEPQVRQARALGIQATLLGSDSWPHSTFSQDAAFNGAYQAVPWHSSAGVAHPLAANYFAAYEEAWGMSPPDYISPALAFDAAGMILHCLRQVGRPDPQAVRDALAEIVGYPGFTGEITYRDTGGDPSKQGVILQLRDGKARFVERLPAVSPLAGRLGSLPKERATE